MVGVFGGDDGRHGASGPFAEQDLWLLRLAAVEAGKWVGGRPGRRSNCDAFELVDQDGAGDHRQELSIVA